MSLRATAIETLRLRGPDRCMGTFSCDADRFQQLLNAAPDEHVITPGLAVGVTDGSWIDWETDDFGENGSWQTKRTLERGERPLTVIATEDGTEIDEANGLHDGAEEAAS